jgi:hypothetical protein
VLALVAVPNVMRVTEAGMVTVVNAGQLKKAWPPIVLIEAGRVMLVKKDCAKAFDPIVVREVGRVIEVKLLRYIKACLPIVVTVLGIIMLVMLFTLSKPPLSL